MPGGPVVPMQFGGVEVLVETVRVGGTEPTSTGGPDVLVDALELAQEVITAAATSTAHTVRRLGEATRPDRVEVEFGIGFSLKANVIVASGAADATLKVKLVYEAHTDDTPQP
ncbi:CU044_2847 family protein [Nocardia sp. alder85J]|uniref:CU044_2847 family protein n=1 Tax=Nocardia sp. alder85J TaxID=2862949 RepID=UPI001CD3FCED|nr:CU044_2847 family protein [Nocardia sp. alder85J]MCX4094505.1 CU044_2847 family protein [Nocardia sp. alder85J]